MNKTEIINGVTRTFYKVGFQVKKHSPEILAAVGVVGTVASTVMACKATTKVGALLDETKEQIDGIHEVLENPVLGKKYEEKYGEKFTVEESKKELAIVYIQTGAKFVKLYGPSVILGAASLGCLLASNNILRKRNVAIAAAYATVEKSFKKYRGRVIDRFGKEVDKELRYNIQKKEIEETVVDEKGKEKKIKKTVDVVNVEDIDEFSRLFDETNYNWEKNANYNFMFLRAQQQYCHDKLVSRGWLFLNEVYEQLGFDPVPEGQTVGWIYDLNNPELDNYVDFGFMDMYNANTRDFINGDERSVLLEFNHNGYILDKVKM